MSVDFEEEPEEDIGLAIYRYAMHRLDGVHPIDAITAMLAVTAMFTIRGTNLDAKGAYKFIRDIADGLLSESGE